MSRELVELSEAGSIIDDWDLPEDPKRDEQEPHPDWTDGNSFVIAGPLGSTPARPGEEGRRMRTVAEARRWAEGKYGQLFQGGRNLEVPKRGRWAFRVRRPGSAT